MRTLITFGLGALTMYFLDPQQGGRRRALLRDQITRARRFVRESRAIVHTKLERLTTPEGAQHLGR